MSEHLNPFVKPEVDVEELTDEEQQLILYNDEVHTFDFVIKSLVEICLHNLLQAEQCTLMVHYNGRCAVKGGVYNKLEPMCTALLDRGLSAIIE